MEAPFWMIGLYRPGQDDWSSWDMMPLGQIPNILARALAIKLHYDFGHQVLLYRGLEIDAAYGPEAERWKNDPPGPPPVEIRSTSHTPEDPRRHFGL